MNSGEALNSKSVCIHYFFFKTQTIKIHAIANMLQCWTIGAIFTFGRSRSRRIKKIKTYIIKAKIQSKLVNLILDLKAAVHYFMLNLTIFNDFSFKDLMKKGMCLNLEGLSIIIHINFI